MLLKKLRVENFRQFLGEVEIPFCTDYPRNVTLIHGENGSGKTTLLNAILWCLFEKLIPGLERPDELICNAALRQGRKSASVDLHFEHESLDYLALRTIENDGRMTFKVFAIEEGHYKELPSPKAFINRLLPSDMADYFFFHGEGISTLAEASRGEKFRGAIRDILGFSFAESAISDLTALKRRHATEAAKVSKEHEKLKVAAQERADAEEKLQEKQLQLRNVQEQIATTEEKIEDYSARLNDKGSDQVKLLNKNLQESISRKSQLEIERAQKQNEKRSLVQRYGWAVFAREAAGQDLNFIDEESMRGRIPAPYQESFVRDLLERGSCVCGSSLENDPDLRRNVEALLENAGRAEASQRAMQARSVAASIRSYSIQFLDEIRRVESDLERIDSGIAKEEGEIQDLQSELDGVDEEEIRRIASVRDKAHADIKQLSEKRALLNRDIEELNGTIERCRRELQGEQGTDARVDKLNDIQELINALVERCRNKLLHVEDSSRLEIKQRVNEILTKFSRNGYQVEISENFEFFLVREDGGVVAKSTGERLLLNLSFVSALIALARERENDNDEFLVQGTVAPFVIDAPFGELDTTYRNATARFLPDTAKQLIILLSSSHWEGVEESMAPYVGAEYILVSHTTGEKLDRPEDLITIRGVEYRQSVYADEEEYTSVMEV